MDDLFRVPVLGWRFGLDAIDRSHSRVLATLQLRWFRFTFSLQPSGIVFRRSHCSMGLNIAIDYVVDRFL